MTSGSLLSQGLLDFSDVALVPTWANSNYNALEATLEKRVGAVRLLAAYTYSKSLDDSSCDYCGDNINPYNGHLSKALSTFDMAQNFVVSYSYDLPFQKLGRSTSGPVHKFLDGWQLSGITRFTTGFPVTIGETGDQSLCGQVHRIAGLQRAADPIFQPSRVWFAPVLFCRSVL